MAGIAAGTQELLDSITEEEWIGHYNELVVYAEWKCRRLHWRNGTLANLPGAHSPDTLVREAVARMYAGDRVWNHQRYPEPHPVAFLKSVIDSEISGLVRGDEHKRSVYLADQQRRRTTENDTYDLEVRGSEDVPDLARSEPLSPEQDAYFGEIERQIHTAIEDRPDLVGFFALMQAGHSPAEISRQMNVSPDAVYQMRKLFDARTVSIKNELLGHSDRKVKRSGGSI